MDREYWYHRACDDLEWRETLAKYQCQPFDFSKFPAALENLKQLSFADLLKTAAKFGIPPAGKDDREFLEIAIYYKPKIEALLAYCEDLAAYISRFSKCAEARENYYQECKENDDGHVEDSGHRNARLTFNRYVKECKSLQDEMLSCLFKLRREHKRAKKDLHNFKDTLRKQEIRRKQEDITKEEKDKFLTVEIPSPQQLKLSSDTIVVMDKTGTKTKKKKKKKKKKTSETTWALLETQKLFREKEAQLYALLQQAEVSLPYLKELEILLKMTTVIKQKYAGDKVRLKSIMEKYDTFTPSPHDYAFISSLVPAEQRQRLIEIIIDHGTLENIDLWLPFFDAFYIYENNDQVGHRSLTGYPFLSSNKAYPLFINAMKYYMNKAMSDPRGIEFNRIVLSRIVTLLDRRKLQLYFQELQEVGSAMTNISEMDRHLSVWQDLNQDLSSFLVYRVQSIRDYVGKFLDKYGYNTFTCAEVEDILRRTRSLITAQAPDKLVKINSRGVILNFKIEWAKNNQGQKAFDKMYRDFQEKCQSILQ